VFAVLGLVAGDLALIAIAAAGFSALVVLAPGAPKLLGFATLGVVFELIITEGTLETPE
jgi:hypothetical protein